MMRRYSTVATISSVLLLLVVLLLSHPTTAGSGDLLVIDHDAAAAFLWDGSTTTTSMGTEDNDDDAPPIVTGCASLTDPLAGGGGRQAIPDDRYWAEMRSAYIHAVGPEAATFRWPTTTSSSQQPPPPQTGLVPGLTEIRYTADGRGRGVFATQFLPAGTVVWDERFNAQFATEASMRRFLSSISEEQACDALQWCYAMAVDMFANATTTGEETIGVACDLDEGSLFNHAVAGIANCADTEEEEDGIDGVVTVRDVYPGEELTQDYFQFEVELEWFEDIMEDAWGAFGEWDEQQQVQEES